MKLDQYEQSTQLRPGTASYGSGKYTLIVRDLSKEHLREAKALLRLWRRGKRGQR